MKQFLKGLAVFGGLSAISLAAWKFFSPKSLSLEDAQKRFGAISNGKETIRFGDVFLNAASGNNVTNLEAIENMKATARLFLQDKPTDITGEHVGILQGYMNDDFGRFHFALSPSSPFAQGRALLITMKDALKTQPLAQALVKKGWSVDIFIPNAKSPFADRSGKYTNMIIVRNAGTPTLKMYAPEKIANEASAGEV